MNLKCYQCEKEFKEGDKIIFFMLPELILENIPYYIFCSYKCLTKFHSGYCFIEEAKILKISNDTITIKYGKSEIFGLKYKFYRTENNYENY
jgi:adenine-specific DNA methylase